MQNVDVSEVVAAFAAVRDLDVSEVVAGVTVKYPKVGLGLKSRNSRDLFNIESHLVNFVSSDP